MLLEKQFEINSKNSTGVSLSHDSLAFFLISMCNIKNRISYLANSTSELNLLKKKISQIDPLIDVFYFPNFDCNFFSNVSPSKEIFTKRIKVLSEMRKMQNRRIIFLTSLDCIIYKTLKANSIKSLLISKDCPDLGYEFICNFLQTNSYERVDFVRQQGEYSCRGNILDIFSPSNKKPIRLYFDFEVIENLSFFDPIEQTSLENANEYEIISASEIIYSEKNITLFREFFRKLNIKDDNGYYKSISNSIILPGSEQYFPILIKHSTSLFSYFEKFQLILDFQFEENLKKIINEKKYENNYLNKLFEDSKLLLSLDEFRKNVKIHSPIILNFSSQSENFVFAKTIKFKKKKDKNLISLVSKIRLKPTNTIFIILYESIIFEKYIENLLESKKIRFKIINSFEFFNKDINIFLFKFDSKTSFKLNYHSNNLFFITQHDLFEKVIKKDTIHSSSSDNLINEISELSINDLVVHSEHGVGQYVGLRKQSINDVEQDFLELIYQGNDKLLIPVENLDLISRYGDTSNKVLLDKLGLQSWQQRKASIKKKIKDIAIKLTQTAAERKLRKGEYILPQTIPYEQFSSEFEFNETSDQLKSINQIELDLSSGNPMDRLICGDVGFGKTEIAMRAAFIVFSAGFQVALICPKLLLVNQHYSTFKKRFANFNCVIGKISRSESLLQKNKIKEDLRTGFINILIGTHAILSKDIEFNKLGLIIVDEEQSFGVEQKEKLKILKPNCHILTLSATPIPRTLQSSLFNIRDISLIKTPPVDRLNVKTFLSFYNPEHLRKIINFEIDRGGQIFYVVPRIEDLENVKKKLGKIIKNDQYEIIHGKLKTVDIEKVYEKFFNNKIKILISTAMIESGLDVSNANTIIIEKPFLFGLAQLYQLRGRVGRSSKQAYAYFFIEKSDLLNSDRINKLEIITKIKNLGSGFAVATSDLDIRGAGNIIGSQQSGHIREVGIELYYKMVNEAVNEILNKNKPEEKEWSPIINVGFSITIPNSYISSLDHRLSIYRKISIIKNEKELSLIFNELEDRFGKVPKQLNNFFKVIEMKILAKKLFISKIEIGEKGCIFSIKDDNFSKVQKIIDLAKIKPEIVKIHPKNKFIYFPKKLNKMEKINDIINFMHSLLNN